MKHNIYLYILVMAAVTYLIRVLPLTLIKKEIKNKTVRSFLFYVPYVTLAVMTFPAILTASNSMVAAGIGFVVALILAWRRTSMFVVSLVSCALTQKLDPKFSIIHRFFIGFGVTDEIFGISVARKGKLNPCYMYGAMSIAIPAWTIGTCLGVVLGNVLPGGVVSALSVALYGMFLAIIIPPARDNKVIRGLVIIAMAASFLFTKIPVIKNISSGMKVIILTVVISGVAAVLFPLPDEEKEEEEANHEA